MTHPVEGPRGGRLRMNYYDLGLPVDAEIIGVTYDPERRAITISLIHESLPPVDSSATEWPDIRPDVETVITFRPNIVLDMRSAKP